MESRLWNSLFKNRYVNIHRNLTHTFLSLTKVIIHYSQLYYHKLQVVTGANSLRKLRELAVSERAEKRVVSRLGEVFQSPRPFYVIFRGHLRHRKRRPTDFSFDIATEV